MNQRQSDIIRILKKADRPVSASALAEHFHISRQSIVGDIALLRASGESIIATARGYVLSDFEKESWSYIGTIACRHTSEQLIDELYTIVDLGGTVIDVSIEHAIYGELTGRLGLSSRYDVDIFLKRVADEKSAVPLSTLTGGLHLHRIGCKDKETFERIVNRLSDIGIVRQ